MSCDQKVFNLLCQQKCLNSCPFLPTANFVVLCCAYLEVEYLLIIEYLLVEIILFTAGSLAELDVAPPSTDELAQSSPCKKTDLE